nr:GntR family transcriptional regulator [Brevundimonas subvibrioides]
MNRKHDPFTQALESLRARAEQGAFTPGAPVVIIEEARRLGLSPTPVREALGWLCGFGLMERAPMGGFLAPRLDPALVRDRLAFRLVCLETSLNGLDRAPRPVDRGSRPSPVCRSLAEQMLRAVRSTGNAAMVDAYQRVNSQLVQFAGVERQVFGNVDEEADALVRLFKQSTSSDLVEALAVYHNRRMDAAPLLILEAEAGRAVRPPDS